MKTLFLTTSPKKHTRWANSTYFLWLTKLFCAGKDVVQLHLGGKKDYEQILEACRDADVVVMAMPVYVDAIPSHVLAFLEVAEAASTHYNWHCKVYAIANCGFYEGRHCECLLEQMQCWCQYAKLAYGGGVGVGAGEMLGILRLTNVACAILLLIVQALCGIASAVVNHQPLLYNACISVDWLAIGINIGIFLLYSLGLYRHTFQLAQAIRQRKTVQNSYTTVWFCGRWLFMVFASLFWSIRAAGHAVPIWAMFRKAPPETH